MAGNPCMVPQSYVGKKVGNTKYPSKGSTGNTPQQTTRSPILLDIVQPSYYV